MTSTHVETLNVACNSNDFLTPDFSVLKYKPIELTEYVFVVCHYPYLMHIV